MATEKVGVGGPLDRSLTGFVICYLIPPKLDGPFNIELWRVDCTTYYNNCFGENW